MEEILIKTEEKDEAVSLLRSAIGKEIAFIKTSLLKIDRNLKRLQEKYGVDIKGAKKEGLDDMEIVEWEGEEATRKKLLKKIESLRAMSKWI